jgi:hypothetical protein
MMHIARFPILRPEPCRTERASRTSKVAPSRTPWPSLVVSDSNCSCGDSHLFDGSRGSVVLIGAFVALAAVLTPLRKPGRLAPLVAAWPIAFVGICTCVGAAQASTIAPQPTVEQRCGVAPGGYLNLWAVLRCLGNSTPASGAAAQRDVAVPASGASAGPSSPLPEPKRVKTVSVSREYGAPAMSAPTEPPGDSTPFPEPRRVKTVFVRPDDSIVRKSVDDAGRFALTPLSRTEQVTTIRLRAAPMAGVVRVDASGTPSPTPAAPIASTSFPPPKSTKTVRVRPDGSTIAP